MTKRELYKLLKKEKLFSLFCLVIASAFYYQEEPKSKKETYLNFLLDGTLNDELIIQMIENWRVQAYCPKLPKIQP